MALELGQKSKFIEHWALVTDLDSLMEEPYSVLMIEGCEDVEEKVERIAVKGCVLAMNNNSLEAEYHGTTGRTVTSEVRELKGKLKWRTIEELTPATEDLQSYYKM